MTFLSALAGFLAILPQVFSIFTKLSEQMEKNDISSFFNKIDQSVSKLSEAKNAKTIEEKRKLRQEALRLGSGAFGDID